MARRAKALYRNNNSGYWFARWYEDEKRIMLSLGTKDEAQAIQRLPIVQNSKMSYDAFLRTTQGFQRQSVMTVEATAGTAFTPALTMPAQREGVIRLIEEAVIRGQARFDEASGHWIIPRLKLGKDVVGNLVTLKAIAGYKDDLKDIEDFYLKTIPAIYTDRETAERWSKIWMRFLKEKKVHAWAQISEPLLELFRQWRRSTIFATAKGKPPSGRVIGRHLHYLSRSFDIARDRGFLKFNPIRDWKPEQHTTPTQASLTVNELKGVLRHEKLSKAFLMRGPFKRVDLSFRLVDFILILFAGCKRRKEIQRLMIEGISYSEHYATYIEHKNSSKGSEYSIQKAFWLTPAMEDTFKRIIGERKSGAVFQIPGRDFLSLDYISKVFKSVVKEVAPTKNISLKNLRQTATDFMEHAKVSMQDQDFALGHYNVSSILKHYQDRSSEAVATRLAPLTRPGVEVLSKAVEEFF